MVPDGRITIIQYDSFIDPKYLNMPDRILALYQNSDTNLPPGYNPNERTPRKINKAPKYFRDREDEEKWRHELKMDFPVDGWYLDR
jgi:hypothetical protein